MRARVNLPAAAMSVAAMLVFSGSARSAVLVSVGGNMVPSDHTFQSNLSTTTQLESNFSKDFNGDGNQTSKVIFRPLDLDAPWLATSGSYSGPAMYGGLTAISNVSVSVTTGRVIENVAGDYLRPAYNFGTGSTTRASATIFLFAVADPGAGQYTQFNTGDSLTHAVGAVTTNNASGRFVVRAEGQFYLSSTNGSASLGTVDPSAITWAAYNVDDGDNNLLVPGSVGTPGSLTFNVAGSSLKDIDFIGYVASNTSSSGTASHAPSMGSFGASISVVVPEPTTFSLLALASLPALRRRRA